MLLLALKRQDFVKKNFLLKNLLSKSGFGTGTGTKIFRNCAAHIGMGGVKIKKEPCQRDEYVYRIS
jgi:hypothetical protein